MENIAWIFQLVNICKSEFYFLYDTRKENIGSSWLKTGIQFFPDREHYHQFYPIAQEQIIKNPNLEQNEGY
ncbi:MULTISPECIES: RagB/SusD family nutrient uptake outer membrane protein [Sphingobacterium]|uniref:RagB/SusD family nutrient uptake outer membrane protein n=1 Tax=Sphingobacterium tenebrionis TaxID=3111775 RepID=A0ABU8I739_9SPHI|nr:RagB/SusD family nutrient uptake outer membrane protein [Sphingobacterium sp. 1.A.4]